MSEVRIVGNDIILSVDEVVATIENAALIEDNKRLQAENDKLRELIHDMNECIEHSSLNCDGCSLDKCELYEFNCRMRELGVDV